MVSPFAASSWAGRYRVLERVHLDRPLTAERRQPLRLVHRLGVLPRHLQHDLSAIAVGARRDPRAVAARFERLADRQPPACGQLLDPVRERSQPGHTRRSAHVRRRLQVGGHPQPRAHAPNRTAATAVLDGRLWRRPIAGTYEMVLEKISRTVDRCCQHRI